VRDSLADIQSELAGLRRFRKRLALREWADTRAPLLAEAERLSADAIRPHIVNAVASADVRTDPTSYMVVDNLLPPEFYRLLAAAIPPGELFPDRDPVKQDFEMGSLEHAPPLTERVWRFFDDEIVGRILAPAIFDRLRSAVVEHYAETGGAAFGQRAAAIRHRAFAGRIQLRRPGYHLGPHLDPKRVVLTGLIYFPRPGDTEAYGTQLFRVNRPFVASGMKTFFPEAAGLTCEVADTIPYRPNTMLAFVNSKAAHGATLPPGAPLEERYAYQFYVKPVDGELKKLLRDLPEEERSAWNEIL
jgi:hypothetical protein